MKNDTRQRRGLAALALAVMLGPLTAAGALAGPAEDYAEADKLFASGELIVAMQLALKAAEAGHAEAQARVGSVLDKSEEDDQAFEWFSKSAAQGNAAGQFGLGEMYAKGEGAPQDMARAYALLVLAADQGHPQATMMIMLAYQRGGLGLKPDPGQHQVWLEKLKLVMPAYQPAVAAPAKARVVRRRGERK